MYHGGKVFPNPKKPKPKKRKINLITINKQGGNSMPCGTKKPTKKTKPTKKK